MNQLQARHSAVINASADQIWSVITDITVFPKINPGVVKVTGTMNQLNGTRTCEISNKGRKGTITEKLIELVPNTKTVWTIESDTMGMSKMLKATRFCFILEKINDAQTKVISETWYAPANFFAVIMNRFMMKKWIAGAQQQILHNIQSLTENKQP
jgi:hypothetical protein